MCCIFTCCGWIIDLVQRLWTFTMSCCISSAVCCSLMTASMSGIAMGYNYSLAEYIDLKETNVSVYLKRGVFDDDVSDDLDWRRSGHRPQSGVLRDQNVVTAEHEEETLPPRSGRRLDDSVLQSNDHNNFEGSLMRLTAKPPGATNTARTVTSDEKIAEIIEKYTSNSLDQLKAIHELMNMRKSNDQRATINYDKTTTRGHDINNYFPGARRMMIEPDSPARHTIFLGDRVIPFEHSTFRINPVRTAVPDEGLIQAPNWFLPGKDVPQSYARTMHSFNDYDNIPTTAFTYPHPIRYNTAVSRPTRVQPLEIPTPQSMAAPNEVPMFKDTRRLENSELNRVRDKLLLDKANFPSFQKSGYMQSENEVPSKSEDADYEEDAKRGIQMRNKRYIKDTPLKRVIIKETSYTEHVSRAIFNKYVQIDHDIIRLKQDVVSELHPVSDEEMVANNVNIDHTESYGITLNATTEKLNIDNIKKRNKSIFTINSDNVHNDTDIGVKENISLINITTERSTTIVKVKVSTPLSQKSKTDTFMVRLVKLLSS